MPTKTATKTSSEAPKYEVPKGEEGYVHAELQIKQFDRNTGEPLFKPFVQKYDPKAWANFLEHKNGYTVNEVLHIPKGVPATLDELKASRIKKK